MSQMKLMLERMDQFGSIKSQILNQFKSSQHSMEILKHFQLKKFKKMEKNAISFKMIVKFTAETELKLKISNHWLHSG